MKKNTITFRPSSRIVEKMERALALSGGALNQSEILRQALEHGLNAMLIHGTDDLSLIQQKEMTGPKAPALQVPPGPIPLEAPSKVAEDTPIYQTNRKK